MSKNPALFWKIIFTSNSDETYFGISIDNRDDCGHVDFEKMIGLDRFTLINIVSNAEDAAVSGKKLQIRITHNDGM